MKTWSNSTLVRQDKKAELIETAIYSGEDIYISETNTSWPFFLSVSTQFQLAAYHLAFLFRLLLKYSALWNGAVY